MPAPPPPSRRRRRSPRSPRSSSPCAPAIAPPSPSSPPASPASCTRSLARARVADAADVVQDVFLTAYERLGELREPAAFPGWLLQIARNRAVDLSRAPRPVE